MKKYLFSLILLTQIIAFALTEQKQLPVQPAVAANNNNASQTVDTSSLDQIALKEKTAPLFQAMAYCKTRQIEAETACDIKQNSQVAEAVIGINQLTQTLQNAGMSLESNCHNLGSLLNIAQNSMSAMKTDC